MHFLPITNYEHTILEILNNDSIVPLLPKWVFKWQKFKFPKVYAFKFFLIYVKKTC